MTTSSALSVATFSVVMTETLIAVAASTLAPALFIGFLRAAKAGQREADAAAPQAGNGGGAAPNVPSTPGEAIASLNDAATNVAGSIKDTLLGGFDGVEGALSNVVGAIDNIEELELMVPRTAKVKTEFEFEASEQYAGQARVGAQLNIVSVAAGYSALFTTNTRNRITMEMDFAAVNYRL